MTNPVMKALLQAKLDEQPTKFGRWCVTRGKQSFPAAPADVAEFARDSFTRMPMQEVWWAVQEVAVAHLAQGLANPCAGGVVAYTINNLSPVEPPRSWPAPMKKIFTGLPWDVQRYLEGREHEREKVVRNAQRERADAVREAAELRKQLAALKQQEQKSNETDTQNQIAAA
jgi:hypothetical protein